MTRRFSPRHIVFVVLLACRLGALSAKAPRAEIWVPDTDAETTAVLNGETWTAVGPDFTLRLQRIDEDQRRAYVKKTTGKDTDPFAAPPGQPPGFVTFLIQLENNGGSNLDFRADQCWLVTNRNEILHPISTEGLRARFGLTGREMGPAYESSLQAVIPSQHSVYGGRSMAGLLVYRAFKEATRKYRLDIQITTPNGDVARVSLPYRKIKVKQDGEH